MDIGKKLRELRKQNDLTLEDLASRSELTKGFLSQVERNLTAPSIATLEDILEALGSNLSEFFHEEEEKQRKVLAFISNSEILLHMEKGSMLEAMVPMFYRR